MAGAPFSSCGPCWALRPPPWALRSPSVPLPQTVSAWRVPVVGGIGAWQPAEGSRGTAVLGESWLHCAPCAGTITLPCLAPVGTGGCPLPLGYLSPFVCGRICSPGGPPHTGEARGLG